MSHDVTRSWRRPCDTLRHACPLQSPDAIVRSSLACYTSLHLHPANPLQYTVLSTFTVVRAEEGDPAIKVVSLATGVKCLPASRLSPIGDTVHDSHAEILARRGF